MGHDSSPQLGRLTAELIGYDTELPVRTDATKACVYTAMSGTPFSAVSGVTPAGASSLCMRWRMVAVPGYEQVAVLAGAVREGDLSAVQADRLAGLVERVGAGVRMAAEYPECAISLVRLWEPVAERFAELMACSR